MDLLDYLSEEEWQAVEAGNLDGTQIIDKLIVIFEY